MTFYFSVHDTDAGTTPIWNENTGTIDIFSFSQNQSNVETNEYTVSIPSNIQYGDPKGPTLEFKKDDTVIGGINTMSYYSDQPFSQLYPNHSEAIENKKIDGLSYETYEVKLNISSKFTSVKSETHFYFLQKDKNSAYDLYFNDNIVDDNTALAIAKSFKLK